MIVLIFIDIIPKYLKLVFFKLVVNHRFGMKILMNFALNAPQPFK